MLDQQLAQVPAGPSQIGRVEAGVVQGNDAAADVDEGLSDNRVAFPGVNAFGSADRTKRRDESVRDGKRGTNRRCQQIGEVVPECAAGAAPVPVALAFLTAAGAIQCGDDSRTISAKSVLTVAAGQQPLSTTFIAYAVGSGGLSETDAADPAVGPGDPGLRHVAAASVADHLSCTSWAAATTSGGLSRHGSAGHGLV